jgi:GlpG protein
VFDEDKQPQAKKELEDFTRDPADPRFAAARQAAEATRRRLEKAAEEYAAVPPARPEPPARPGPGPWTYGLMLTCVLVFVAHTGYLISQNRGLGSGASLNLFLWGNTEGQVVFTGPVEQALAIAPFQVDKQGKQIEWNDLDALAHGQVWRLVTPIFLHFGAIHLLFNMTMLWQLGGAFERRRGAWRYLLFALACAVASNVAQYFLGGGFYPGTYWPHPSPLFGGMSAVLYGLFGYVWMKSRYEPEMGLWLGPRTVFYMLGWLVLCMTGLLGPIGNVAHVTGLIAGVVIGAAPHLWRLARRGSRPT